MSSRKAEHQALFVSFVRKGTALFRQGQTPGALVAFRRALLYARSPRDRAMVKAFIQDLQQQIPRPVRPCKPLSLQKKVMTILAGVLIAEGVLLSVPRVFASVAPPAARPQAQIVRPKPASRPQEQEAAQARYLHAAVRAEPGSDARLLTLLPQNAPLRLLPNNLTAPQWFVRESLEDNHDKLWLKVETADGISGWMESGALLDSRKMPLIPAQVLQDGTILRQAPSLQARSLAVLSRQSQVLLLPKRSIMEDEQMWFQVRLPSGSTGWVASDDLAGFNGYGMAPLLDALIAQSVETVFSGQEESYQDHYQQAISHYSTAIAINRTYLNIEDAKVFAHRGHAYKSLGQCNQAMQDFARACRHGHGPACQANCL